MPGYPWPGWDQLAITTTIAGATRALSARLTLTHAFIFHIALLITALSLLTLALLATLTLLALLALLTALALLVVALTTFVVVAILSTATLVATLGILVVCHFPAPVNGGRTMCPSLQMVTQHGYSA